MTDETTRPTTREPDHAIEPIFAERWSPRVFTGEAVPETELLRMFEAARWSPSSYNSQPWRFLYALRGTPEWQTFFDLLVPGNQKWAEGTGALVFLVSSERMKVGDELKSSASHSLDAGAASLAFALQANRQGWHVHGMGGFDRERAPAVLNVPEHHRVEAAYGIGRATPWAELSEEQRAKERPNGRRPITDFAFRGGFPQRQD
ncbi:putative OXIDOREDUCTASE PROTEIN [Methylorubrum extorquens]|uniref:Putative OXIDOREDUCTASE PROTEIN n=1 Tax=Methylorubrum extorquens TaxID=408 RepID=A0A2N9AJK2_METEX|nr:nitroreductase family protein [Methylorubrum zatmanii]ARO53422.1 nitroreductase [Methylorubrum zatmanii]KQP99444.1 nitroreductase [Methylobacterium sp. Leaf121]SOR27493.1 putative OXIDOREDUCTASE PROTEIN [Methylorubrum extorquens]